MYRYASDFVYRFNMAAIADLTLNPIHGEFTEEDKVNNQIVGLMSPYAAIQIDGSTDRTTMPIRWHQRVLEAGFPKDADTFRRLQTASFAIGREAVKLQLITDTRRYS